MFRLHLRIQWNTHIFLRTTLLFILFFCFGATEAAPEAPLNEDLPGLCSFLGRVEGDSGYGKNTNWKVLAHHYAKKRAEKLGGNHLIYEKYTEKGSFNGVVTAKVYRCNDSQKTMTVLTPNVN